MGNVRPFWRIGLGAPPEPPYAPTVDWQYKGTAVGSFMRTPLGVILHGSRSGIVGKSIEAEYRDTARYAASGIGLGWTATVGEDRIAIHTSFKAWGWNARGCSSLYLAVEIAQANLGDHVSDGQVRAVAWFWREAREVWGKLPKVFPNHSDLDGTPAYGPLDGKTDVERKGVHTVRDRVLAELARQGG